MLNVIKKYFIWLFIISLSTNSLRVLTKRTSDSLLGQIETIAVSSIIMAAVLLVVCYFQDTKWGPSKRRKLLNKKPFTDLMMNRFVIKDYAVVGLINNYTIVVSYEWPKGGSAILIKVLFAPNSKSTDKRGLEDLKENNKTKDGITDYYIWTSDSIAYMDEYAFTPTSYEEVIKFAELMVGVLKTEGLVPRNYLQTETPIASNSKLENIGVH